MHACMLMSHTELARDDHYCTRQQALVEFHVPVFKHPESPGYTCCVPKPFFSLVAGNTVQEVEEAVEECVADFSRICKEDGHIIPVLLWHLARGSP